MPSVHQNARINKFMILHTKISSLRRLDIYRDGGSVSVSFTGRDGIEYCLFFGIAGRREHDALPRYRSPMLQWLRAAEYRSPITGDTSPTSIQDEMPITWSEARRILRELSPFYENFVSNYRSVFVEMVDAARNDGRLTSG